MIKHFAISLVLGSLLFGVEASKIEEISGFKSPESVFVGKDFIYVSNVGEKLEPLTKDYDGSITKLNHDGKVIEKDFITRLHAPKGLIEIDKTLYVLDIDTIKGFDLNSKKEVFNLPIPNSVFLNAIAALDKNTIFISDTGTGIIHKVNLKDKTFETFYTMDLQTQGGPNGMLIHNNELIIAGYHPDGNSGGIVFGINLDNKKTRILINNKESFDGIVLTKNGEILVSSWGEDLKGHLYTIYPNGKIEKLNLPEMKGPADMDLSNNTLWIPKMVEGKILKVQLQ